jgi:hypothetical protein
LTIEGSTLTAFVTALLSDGVGVSVEVALATFEIVYGFEEIGSVVLAETSNETVAVSPGASEPTFQVTVPPNSVHDVPPEQLPGV